MAATEAEQLEELKIPAPLEFLTTDYIHPDNLKLMQHEQERWRLLSWLERWRLRRYVNEMGHQLKKRGYNKLVQQRQQLYELWLPLRQQQLHGTFINDEARRQVNLQIKAIMRERRRIVLILRDLKDLHERYAHYAGWLEYEQQHRRELRIEAARDKRNRKDMRKEGKWIETLVRDVWRNMPGCHYTFKDDKGREVTRVPEFQLVQNLPDVHYLWLKASNHGLFGWRWKLPHTVSTTRLVDEEVIENMKVATKRQVSWFYTDQGQIVIRVNRLDRPDALPTLVRWRDAMKFYPEDRREKLAFCVGVDEARRFHWFDFASNPHILIGGKSQSGKSNFVNGIIASILATHSPAEVRVVFFDQKGGIEATHWSEVPHLLWEIAKSTEQVEPYLQRLVAAMRKRMSLLEQIKAKDIAAFNARVDVESRLARVLVVIDEMATFVGLGAQTETIHNLIMLLTSQGRAVGIHVIAATQRPEVKVVPGRLKTNMDPRVCFPVPTVADSQIVLDSPEAHRLPAKAGRAALVSGLQTLILQTPLIPDDDIGWVTSVAKKQHKDVPNDLPELLHAPKLTVWDQDRVLAFALANLDGQLSGEKMHHMLGTESPGERQLRKIARNVIDAVAANGRIEHEGNHYVIRRKAKAYFLQSVQSDNQPVLESPGLASGSASD